MLKKLPPSPEVPAFSPVQPTPKVNNPSTIKALVGAPPLAPSDLQKEIQNYVKSKNVTSLAKVSYSNRLGFIKEGELTGEAALVAKQKPYHTIPTPFSSDEIAKAFDSLSAKPVQPKKPVLNFVLGVDANDLHNAPLGNNAMVMAASQFNYLESANFFKATIEAVFNDKTQGPALVTSAITALVDRMIAEENGTLPHMLSNLLTNPPLSDKLQKKMYENGYLKLYKLTKDEQKRVHEHFAKNIGKLNFLAQNVVCEASGKSQLQVFCAAPSFQNESMLAVTQPAANSINDLISRLLVVEQYKNAARLAVIRSQETGETVPLHLTLVGQGVFRNSPDIMKEAMEAVADIVKGHNVQLYVHTFNDMIKNNLLKTMAGDNPKFGINQITKDDFYKMPHPAPYRKN